MMFITERERQKIRQAFWYGWASGKRPPSSRNERVEFVRRSLRLLDATDRYAVLVEFLVGEGTEGMVRAASLLLGAAVTIGQYMPDVHRVCFASTFNEAAAKLAFPAEQIETMH